MTAPPLPRKNNVSSSEPPPLPRKDSNAGVIGGVFIPPDALETPNPSVNQVLPPPLPKKEIISSSPNSIVGLMIFLITTLILRTPTFR